eukprot:13607486-Heterocapsa_arctica.AAC.1
MFSHPRNLLRPSLLPLTQLCVIPNTGQMNSPYVSTSRSPTRYWTPPTAYMPMMLVVLAPVSLQITQSSVYIIGALRWTTTLNNVASFRTCGSDNCSLSFGVVDVMIINVQFSKPLLQM